MLLGDDVINSALEAIQKAKDPEAGVDQALTIIRQAELASALEGDCDVDEDEYPAYSESYLSARDRRRRTECHADPPGCSGSLDGLSEFCRREIAAMMAHGNLSARQRVVFACRLEEMTAQETAVTLRVLACAGRKGITCGCSVRTVRRDLAEIEQRLSDYPDRGLITVMLETFRPGLVWWVREMVA